eukprot:6163827-Ditylum_brightwellii.AAC.1
MLDEWQGADGGIVVDMSHEELDVIDSEEMGINRVVSSREAHWGRPDPVWQGIFFIVGSQLLLKSEVDVANGIKECTVSPKLRISLLNRL